MTGNPFLDAAGIAPVAVDQPTNNPYNLKPGVGRVVYPGQTGTASNGVAIFDSPDSARNAAVWQLQEYQRKAGHPLSFNEIASIYAPKGDGKNDPVAYAKETAAAFGKAPNDTIDLSDPTVAAQLAQAHAGVEQGQPLPSPSGNVTPPSSNPFLDALASNHQGQNGGLPSPGNTGGSGSNPPTDSNGNLVPGGNDPQGGASGAGRLLGDAANFVVQANDPSLTGMGNRAVGLAAGAAAVPESLMHAAAWAIDKTGYGAKTAQKLRQWASDMDAAIRGEAPDPNSPAFKFGNLSGEIGATLPLSEVKVLQGVPKVAAFVPKLARYGDMAIQGAGAGGLLSKGENVGSNMLGGAILAPALGGAADLAGPYVSKATEAVGSSKLAQALRDLVQRAPEETPVIPENGGPTFKSAGSADAFETMPNGSRALKVDIPGDAGGSNDTASANPAGPNIVVENGVKYAIRPDGKRVLLVDVIGGNPPSLSGVSQKDLTRALGSNGARSGLEATTDLPPDVASHVRQLVADGVPLEQALREADITHIGGKPTIAAVTRDAAHQQAFNEGAKMVQTPEGRALNAQAAQNNASVHSAMQGFVQDNGGVQGAGDAAENAAQSLAKASDVNRPAKLTPYRRPKVTPWNWQFELSR
jgi:hypothetical protein